LPEKIRAFIASDISDSVKQELADIISKLKLYCPDFVKWTDPEGIHLTLKFLGWIDENKPEIIIGALSRAMDYFYPFRFSFEGLGAFPNKNNPRVLWIGLSGDVEAVTKLQQRIDIELSILGFETERRIFTPHLTLGRVKNTVTRIEIARLLKALASLQPDTKKVFGIDSVSLFRSQLTPKGAIYTQLGKISLK
jgi:2'-5' RNA ligase